MAREREKYTITLAEALLRRKELQQKVDQLKTINHEELHRTKMKRQNVTDNIEDLLLEIPLLSPGDITVAYDYHARALREIDAVIQQTNWQTNIEVPTTTMDDFVQPGRERTREDIR